MAQPVWQLSINLETKTATFQTGMADAAKAARGSFQDIKSGADDMGRATSGSMMEARHGVMLLGEEFGVRLPRALTTFIASIGPIGAAMEAAFPFLAIIVGATLLLEHLSKLKQAGEALTESQVNFGTAAANVLNSWNDKILQAGIRTDELNGNHLGALNKTLELIDHQSMKELVSSFDTVAKAADATFAQLKTSWYQWGAGSAGAKNSLEQFKVAYDALLAKQDAAGATALLDQKIEREQKILALEQEASRTTAGPKGVGEADRMKMIEARIALQKMGVGYSENEVKAQVIQVGALQDLVKLEAARAALLKADQDNARKTDQNREDVDSDKAAREQAQNQRQAAEEAQKQWEENYRAAVSALQENERQKIDATKQGSAARLAAIDAAIKEEEGKGLQETGFYRSLLTSRVELVRQMTEEQNKLQAEAGKEAAEHAEKMGELQVAAERQAAQLRVSEGRVSAQELLDMEMSFNAQDYALKKQAMEKEIAALDQSDKEYENKKKALNDKLLELDQQLANQDAALLNQSQQKQVASLQTLQKRMIDAYANGFTQVLMRKESFGHMMAQMDQQMASSALKSALQLSMELATVQGRKRFGDARTAAADAFASAGNPILGTVEAATTFAAVMALQDGGIVPGVGKGDTVPAMLEPGEGVLSNKVMEGLKNQARGGTTSGGGDSHFHYNPTIHIQALDRDGLDHALTKHSETVKKHFNNHVRRMNQ
jgi:hypothetical protein